MMEDLWNTVRVRRLTLAGHILWLPSDRPASVAMQWVPDGGRKRRERLKDLATNVPRRFTGDESQLEWCSRSGQ